MVALSFCYSHSMGARTDRNNNPAAITTDVAKEGGLILGTDYEKGEPFAGGLLFTARLLGDPIVLTIRVIDRIGYYTHKGLRRWEYIGIPDFVWAALTPEVKRDVIGFQYQHEGGTELRHLFPNYGKP